MMSCIRLTVEESGTRAESQVGKRDLSPLLGHQNQPAEIAVPRDPLFDRKGQQQRAGIHRLEEINRRAGTSPSSQPVILPCRAEPTIAPLMHHSCRSRSRVTYHDHESRITITSHISRSRVTYHDHESRITITSHVSRSRATYPHQASASASASRITLRSRPSPRTVAEVSQAGASQHPCGSMMQQEHSIHRLRSAWALATREKTQCDICCGLLPCLPSSQSRRWPRIRPECSSSEDSR